MHCVDVSGKVLPNILWLVGERAARAGITATVLSLVARHLQPEQFGRLSFAISTTAIAAAIATLGLEGLVVNALVRRPERVGAVLGTACALRLGAGLLVATILAACAWFVPAWRADAALLGVVALGLLLQPAEVVDLWFQRRLESRRTVSVRFAVVLAGAALRVVLVFGDAPLLAFAWAQVAEVGLLAAGLAVAYRRGPQPGDRWRWDAGLAREFWRRGAPLALGGGAVVLAMRLDQLLVHAYCAPAETGAYFAAARLTEIALLTGTAMTLSFFPALAQTHVRNPDVFPDQIQALFDVLSGFGWLVVLGSVLAGPFAINLLFGSTYAAGATVLALQSVGALFALSAAARWQFILLRAPTMLNLVAAALSIATQLGLAALLLPRYGINGAAVAWVVAAALSGFATSWIFPALRPCAAAQTRALAIPFAPGRWRTAARLFSS